MGKYCTLCKVVAIKGELSRSFHRFPAPQYQKEIWCRALEKDINKLRRWTFVCSDHFSSDNFVYRANGQRFLKDEAIPLPFKGKVKRKKRSSKTYSIDNAIVKTECDEQQSIITSLDTEVKLENVHNFQKSEECIKTEEYKPDEVFVKMEILKCELTEELDIKSEITSEAFQNDEAKYKVMFGAFETGSEAQGEEINQQSELDTETSQKPAGRKKKSSKTLKYSIDNAIVKTECDEQESIFTSLDTEVKLENVHNFQKSEDCIKTEKYKPDEVFVKMEILKSELTEELDIKSEITSEAFQNDEAKYKVMFGAFETGSEAQGEEIFQQSELDTETAQKPAGRKKKSSKTLKYSIDNAIVKTECDEQESIFTSLDTEVKLENVHNFQKSEDCIKTEKYKPDEVFVKMEILKSELTEELDIKSEITSEAFQNDEAKYKVMFGAFETGSEAQGEEIFQQSELDTETAQKPAGYFSTDTNDNILLKMFKSMYPVSSDGVYACVECFFKTSFRPDIRRHFLAHRDNEYKKHPEKYKDYKTFHCKQCNYVSIQRYNVSRHMLKHQPKDESNVTIYYCDHCDYSTKYRCDLIKHRAKHEPDGRRFHCPQCPYKAYEHVRLKRHIEKAHIQNKRYKFECKMCSYKTDCMGHLNRHMRNTHGEDKGQKTKPKKRKNENLVCLEACIKE